MSTIDPVNWMMLTLIKPADPFSTSLTLMSVGADAIIVEAADTMLRHHISG